MRKILAALLLLTTSAFATTPAFVQKATGVNLASAITVVSGSITTTAGNTLIVVLGALVGSNPQPSGCSGQSATFVKAGTPNVTTTGGNGTLYVFYAANIPGATGSVTCTTTSGTGTWMSILVLEYSGLDSAAPLDGSAYTGTDTATSGTITCGTVSPQWDSELVLGGFATGSTVNVPSAAGGYTQRAGQTNGSNTRPEAEELIISNNFIPKTTSWTMNASEDYRCGTFLFKAAGANPYVPPRRTGAVTAQ